MHISFLGRYMRSTTSAMLPLFMNSVPAGFPSPAQDYIERTLDLNDLCIKHPAATYFVRAEGDSMEGVGIFSRDVLVVDRSLKAVNGDIVIACVNGEFTVKELSTRPTLQLLAHNPTYAPIEFGPDSTLELFGVVTTVIHSVRQRG
ncbi:translesion error-prone DNA polymerase V autoproteolytic subunit [Amphritea sp. 2_MG-2023]|jgi:DNA polymerase V|uniref:translesion error-prone DNA polymerase V autoproteolytic subunit n=1 Tax=Amphritea TaxID=515417 RepID=UPI001C07ED5B|nr:MULTISPECIES: translesion error-prone DNA polymerase V autoproteolytic subunit [Amphritea]MBU2966723.1 translesion error-prone DNA polymerase V autoproteolytic subunit [Amphritea atlantica]MDO6417418.1 translesion error-prone DNA polymerase V autoproteolytic subunit [Amphritea sp. 2_MG-2023]MDX2422588.1 translesion error-prone DNA polymerase V autoproteolytic subunit [Amphritea sp.]